MKHIQGGKHTSYQTEYICDVLETKSVFRKIIKSITVDQSNSSTVKEVVAQNYTQFIHMYEYIACASKRKEHTLLSEQLNSTTEQRDSFQIKNSPFLETEGKTEQTRQTDSR